MRVEQDPNLSPAVAQEAASYQQRHERGTGRAPARPQGQPRGVGAGVRSAGPDRPPGGTGQGPDP